MEQHQQGRGARYTRGRTPVKLLAALEQNGRSEAQSLEHNLKRMNRAQKLNEIQSWPGHKKG